MSTSFCDTGSLLTVVALTHVRHLVRLAECMHEIRQGRRIQMGRVVSEQCSHELTESQIQE